MEPSEVKYIFKYSGTKTNKDVYYYQNNEKQEYASYPKRYLRKKEDTNICVNFL